MRDMWLNTLQRGAQGERLRDGTEQATDATLRTFFAIS